MKEENKLITVGELIDILMKEDKNSKVFLSDPAGFYILNINTGETKRIKDIKHW